MDAYANIFMSILTIALVKAGPTPSLQQEILEMAEDCFERVQVTDNDLLSLLQHGVTESTAAQCFIHCMLKNNDFIDDEDMVDAEPVIEEIRGSASESDLDMYDKRLIKWIELCAYEANSAIITSEHSPCRRAAIAFACLRDNSPKLRIDYKKYDEDYDGSGSKKYYGKKDHYHYDDKKL